MANRSIMTNRFSQVPRAQIQRSVFDRTFAHKTTFNAGELIPFFLDEALPGDTWNVNCTLFARLATPIHPIMDNMIMKTEFFSVPIRQLWSNWEKFNGEQEDPGDSIDYTMPVLAAASHAELSMADYFGLPTKVAGLQPRADFFRAYNRCFNHWYRDQNLIDSIPQPTDDGPDPVANYVIRKRAKRHDYFTSGLPWPQKATEGVSIPLGTSADIVVDQLAGGFATVKNPTVGSGDYNLQVDSGTYLKTTSDTSGTTRTLMKADLSEATAATINEQRQAWQIQKLLERDARGGTRYPEILQAHFGVTDPQMAVLQRPEFLGGGSQPLVVSAVQQTSSTDATTPQGNLAAYGTVLGMRNGFTKSFTEHCIIIGFVSVQADLTYQQGIPRMFSRSTRYDFFWPALAHIGEQAILNKEIYFQNTSADDDVFAYQERHAEYRYRNSMISGRFRSNAATPLDAWHLSQEFGSLPTLNQTFIEESPPVDRVVAVATEPDFLFDSYNRCIVARPLPVYGVPGLVDHF